MTKTDELYVILTRWIAEHYGEPESEDPCYDIYALAVYLTEVFNA